MLSASLFVLLSLLMLTASSFAVYFGWFLLRDPFPIILSFTALSKIAEFWLVAGGIFLALGCFGIVARFTNITNGRSQAWFAHTALWIVVMGLAWKVYGTTNRSKWISSHELEITRQYARDVCPNVVGHVCHVAPTSLVLSDNLEAPVYTFLRVDFALVHSSKEVESALIAGDGSLPFYSLCDDVTSRASELPAYVAKNLNTTCQMCGVVEKPTKTVYMRWNDLNYCLSVVLGSKYSSITLSESTNSPTSTLEVPKLNLFQYVLQDFTTWVLAFACGGIVVVVVSFFLTIDATRSVGQVKTDLQRELIDA